MIQFDDFEILTVNIGLTTGPSKWSPGNENIPTNEHKLNISQIKNKCLNKKTF